MTRKYVKAEGGKPVDCRRMSAKQIAKAEKEHAARLAHEDLWRAVLSKSGDPDINDDLCGDEDGRYGDWRDNDPS